MKLREISYCFFLAHLFLYKTMDCYCGLFLMMLLSTSEDYPVLLSIYEPIL